MLLTDIPLLDDLLQKHAAVLGNDFTAYRNHTYRVANLCIAQVGHAPEVVQKVAIAAAFHDLGIWTDGTFDYLPPSIRLATDYLAGAGRTAWTQEIKAMIREHHKITPYRGEWRELVEPFRRADWADVSLGLIAFGLPQGAFREVASTWPSAGFHKKLVQLELGRLRTHPWNPLPMVKL